jgi:peptide/nickel transport system substrate-binding protein
MRRLIKAGAVLAAVTLAGALAACGASPGAGGSGGGTAAKTATLTISNENGALWTCDFSPFNGSDTLLSVGLVYETLDYVNPLQDGKVTPMLASSYSWGAGDKSLTFTIRSGVKFSNGTPLSANDVAYTFNLIKKYPALDLPGVWSVLSSVTATGDQVTMDFSAPAVPWFYYIADQVPIVSQAIWSKIANPVAYPDSHPVGTGPYEVNPCTSSNITYTANPNYWQAGEPKVKKIEYPAFTSNNTANDELANGQAQWGAQYIPSIASFYTAKSPDFHYWFPPTVNVSIVPNLTNPLLSNVKVRQAISYAIDRSKVSSLGESGYEPPANQTGIVTPTFSSSEDSTLVAQIGNSYDPAKAKSLLEQAGYKLNSAGVMTNAKGQSLSFTPSPYYELNNWLNSADTAPIGKVAATNYERYSNATTESLLNQYAATTSTATQQSIMDQIQSVMVNEVPIIPVVEAVDWYQYDTASFSGWPTPSDPYAQPSAYAYPDMEQVLLHLQPK